MGKYTTSLRSPGDTRPIDATVHLDDGRLRIVVGETTIGDWALDEIEVEKLASGFRVGAEGEHLLLDFEDSDSFTAALEATKKPRLPRLRRKKKRERSPKETKEASDLGEAPPAAAQDEAPPPSDAPTPPSPSVTVEEDAVNTDQGETGAEREPRAAGSRAERTLTLIDNGLAASERRYGSLLPQWVFSRFMLVMVVFALLLTVIFPGTVSTVLLIVGFGLILLGAVTYTDEMLASKWLPGRAGPVHVLIAGATVVILGVLLGVVAN